MTTVSEAFSEAFLGVLALLYTTSIATALLATAALVIIGIVSLFSSKPSTARKKLLRITLIIATVSWLASIVGTGICFGLAFNGISGL